MATVGGGNGIDAAAPDAPLPAAAGADSDAPPQRPDAASAQTPAAEAASDPEPGAAPRGASPATWIAGDLRCALVGATSTEADTVGAPLGRLHAFEVRDARAAAVVAVSADEVARHCATAADPLPLGRVEPIALQLAGETRWLRAAVVDAVVVGARPRLGRDDGDRSLLLVEGRLLARVAEAEAPFAHVSARAATIGATAARIAATPLAASGRSLPVAADSIAWGEARVGANAPPDIARVAAGCMLLPLALLLLPLALVGPLLALGLGGVDALAVVALGVAFAGLTFGVGRLLARRGWAVGGLAGLGLAGLAGLLAAFAAVPAFSAFAQGGCAPAGPASLVLLLVALPLAAAIRHPAARVGLCGLAALVLALHAFADRGCQGGALAVAQARSAEALASDPDAERAAALEAGGGGRLSVDQALAQTWPRLGLCGRRIHFSGDLLFATDSAALGRDAAPHLRKQAALARRQPEATLAIEGHADPRGDEAHNVRLSRARAEAVAGWLVRDAGLQRGRVAASGVGAAMPLGAPTLVDDLEAWRRIQRRVEVVLRCAGAPPVAEGL